jgi:hypothetical protein
MNKKLLFAIAFIATLSLASIAGITQAASANIEKEAPQASTTQTANVNSDTATVSNTTLLAKLDNLINSDYFNQCISKWSTTPKAQPHYQLDSLTTSKTQSQHQSGSLDFPYSIYHALYPGESSFGPSGGPARLYTPWNILGYDDLQYAHFHTEIYRPKPLHKDEALLWVQMEAGVTGDIWLNGYTGQYSTSDVFVFGCETSNGNWMAIGSAHFTSHQPQSVFVATTTTPYPYISVFCCSPNQAPYTNLNDAYVDSITIIHDNNGGGGGGGPYIDTSATADVAISPSQESNGNNEISWACADDYGAYYCHVTDVYIDGNWYSPWSLGDDHTGSITFTDYGSHTVDVVSAPDYYPVTFNQYAHNDYCGDMLVNSWTEYHVAWEEVGGPHYSHGSDLHGGGGEDYYVDSAINDPWGWGTDYFSYAMSHNWGGGSETYCYGIPLNVWTFTWGNTVDIYYNYG